MKFKQLKYLTNSSSQHIRIMDKGGSSLKSNFAFLNNTFPVLANFGELAEKYLYNDSNSCLMKLGMIGKNYNSLLQ